MRYIEVFQRYPLVKQLSLLQFVMYFGAWFSNVAIYTLLVHLEATAFMISCVVAAHFLPAILQAPISGAIIDKVKIKPLMITLITIEIMMTIGFFFVNSLNDLWFLIIIVFIRMAAGSFFFTLEMSLLPKIIQGIALQKTNEVHSIIWSFSYAFGMAFGGLFVDTFGIKIAFAFDLFFFLFALIYLFVIRLDIVIEKSQESFTQMVKGGVSYMRRNTKIIHLIVLHCSIALTAFDTLVTLLADYHYKYVISVALAIGFTHAIRAVALMVGPFLLSKYITKHNLFWILLFQGITIIVWAFVQFDFYLSLLAMFFVGLCITTIWSYTYALLQEQIEKEYLGRVIAYNDMIFMLFNVIVTAIIGALASYDVALWFITVLLGCGFLIYAFYARYIVGLLESSKAKF